MTTGDWTSPLNDAQGNPLPVHSLADVPREMVTRIRRKYRFEKRGAKRERNPVTINAVRMSRGFGSY